jgi:epoxyqueuosine reductase QueG
VTFHNEAGMEHPFPEWMPATAHNAIVGCTICQDVCPLNIKYRNDITELMDFSEEETGLLLAGIKEEQLPEGLKDKLNNIEMLGYLEALSRNLKVLLCISGDAYRFKGYGVTAPHHRAAENQFL